MAVLDLDGPKIEHDISGLLPRLAACGRLASDVVTAIMYIEPNGFPGSVGLAAATNLDEGGRRLHRSDDSALADVDGAAGPGAALQLQHPRRGR